jgi:hypothetical protein
VDENAHGLRVPFEAMVEARYLTRGLGIVMRSSSDWAQTSDGRWVKANVSRTCGLNMTHDPMLKIVFKGAATSILQQHRSSVLYAD